MKPSQPNRELLIKENPLGFSEETVACLPAYLWPKNRSRRMRFQLALKNRQKSISFRLIRLKHTFFGGASRV